MRGGVGGGGGGCERALKRFYSRETLPLKSCVNENCQFVNGDGVTEDRTRSLVA